MPISKTVYTIGVPTYWGTLTPPLQHSLVGDAVLEYQGEPLGRMGEQGVMNPLSAKSWEFSADQRRLIFKIDTERRFSDGSCLCAQDFKRSWEDGLRMAPKSSNSSLADGLVNIKGYSSFKKNAEITGIRTVGNDTLIIEFNKPVRLALQYLSGGRFSAYKMVGGHIIGTGPYVIIEKDKELTLTPNPYYTAARPALKKIKIVVVASDAIVEEMKAGRVDAYLFAETAHFPGCDSGQLAPISCVRGQEASHNLIQLNGLRGRIFSDSKHRLAFQALAQKNIAAAEQAFREAGFVRDNQSFLKFQAGRITNAEAAEIIRSGEQYIPRLVKATVDHPLYMAASSPSARWFIDSFKKEGIKFTESSDKDFDFKDLVPMYYKTSAPDIMTITASVSDGDPDGLYHLIGRHGAIFSPMTERKAVCDGMEKGRQLLDMSKLPAHYKEVSRNILKEVPYVHLGYFCRKMAYNADKLQVDEKMLDRNNLNILLLKPH